MTDKTFKPTIREDGVILAGGMKIGELRGQDLVFEDDFFPRVNARQTPDVPVDLADLVEALLDHYAALDRT